MAERIQRLSAPDLSNLDYERPDTPAHIGILAILEAAPLTDPGGGFRLAEARRRMALRLPALPVLRRRIVAPGPLGGRPLWADDPGFAIERHVRLGRVDPPGEEAQLLAAAGRIMRELLDRRRPLWEAWFLTGLAGERVALLIKIHHAIADGLGMAALVTTLFDFEPDAPDPPPEPWRPAAPPSWRVLAAENLAGRARALARGWRWLREPGHLAALAGDLRRTWAMRDQAPATSFNRPIGAGRAFRVLHLDLEEARAAAHAAGGKVNDVVLDVTAGGLRELLRARGEEVAGLELFVSVPVNLRPAAEGGGSLGNQTGGMVVRLPLGQADAGLRLPEIVAATSRAKADQHTDYFQAFANLVSKAPRGFRDHQRFINTLVTNVPGPPLPIYVLGARLLDVIPLSLLVGNVTIAFAAVSYAGRLTVTVTADRDAVPDADAISRGMRESWRELAPKVTAGAGR